MSDYTDWLEEQQRQKAEQDRKNEELRQLYKLLLKRDPTASEYGLDREGQRSDVALRIAGQHQKELATGQQGDTRYTPGLTDPRFREDFRRLLLSLGAESDLGGVAPGRPDEGGQTPTFTQGQLTPEQWRKVSTLEQLQGVPVSFLNPSLTVRRDEVDTPEEVTRYLQAHGGDTQINRQLLQAALDYGGLSIEPTPFGTLSRPGRGLEWTRKSNEPGDLESRFTASGQPLTPQQLSAIAQERQGNFRLEDPLGVWRQVAKGALAVPFSIAGGYLGGAVLGPALGALGGTALVPGAGAGAAIAGSPTAFGIGAGVGGGIGAGAASGALTGDPNEIWQRALVGGAAGGVGAGLGALGGGSLPGNVLASGGKAATSALGSSGFSGNWDPLRILMQTGSGLAGGAAPDLGLGPIQGGLSGLGLSALLGQGHDPLAQANQQLDANALTREQDQQAAMQRAQDEWKQRYAAASAEQQRLMQEQFRAAQQEFESKKAEYEAKLQAFLDERQSQIEEALRAMGLAEPGIAGLLADRQKQIDDAKAEQQAQQAQLVESRNFFPSELMTQTGDTGASSLLVPHSPPPVLFGQEGLPASYTDYAQQGPPTFSSEGFLPSGSFPDAAPPSVAPMGSGGRPPRYFPTLLGGLSRSPYLRYA